MHKGRTGWTRLNTGARDRHPDCEQLKTGTEYNCKLANLLKLGTELICLSNRLYRVSTVIPRDDATETEYPGYKLSDI
jgi:hypothetical protein